MKLPSFRELSTEQDKVYNLPLTSNYLVSGPPGTGKTVIALYRASLYEKQKIGAKLISYSKLLTEYTSSAAEELDIPSLVLTYHSWVSKTYLKYFREFPPELERFVYDWNKITPKLLPKAFENRSCVLVDEGQDLPPEFYTAISLLASNLTVFADENQRITETQSTLEDIKKRANIKAEHRLTRNYRNSYEIAAVASCFYAGLPTGKPDLPTRKGSLPVVKKTTSLDDAVEYIVRYERNHSDLVIGIFAKTNRLQRTLLEKLKSKTKNQVQIYESGNTEMPDFGKPGIKIVSFRSAKGLEFDAVFIPELQNANLDVASLETKMIFYVLLSRARDDLFMLYSGNGEPPILNLLPRELIDWIY